MKKYQYLKTEAGKENIIYSIIGISDVLKMNIPKELKKDFMDVMIWKISGADGKYKTRYCSCGALQSDGDIQHEHVFTIDFIKNRFLSEGNDFSKTISLIIGCLVTKVEHKTLSKFGRDIVGWERYKKANIEIYDMSGEEPKKCNIDYLINTYLYV